MGLDDKNVNETVTENKVGAVLKLVGLSLAISIVLVLLVGGYTLITGFSLIVWSERTFWLSLIVLMSGSPFVLGALNDKNDYKRTKKEQAPINMKIGKGDSQIVIVDPRKLAWRIMLTGGFCFLFTILIDLISR